MNSKIKNRFLLSLAGCALGILSFSSQAVAVPLEIVEVQSNSQDPDFPHSFFHVNNDGGTSGLISRYVDLDYDATSYYNPETGEVSIELIAYTDAELTEAVATASATGVLDPAGQAGSSSATLVAGYLNFSFSDGTPDTTIFFDSDIYNGSADNYVPNTVNGQFVSLWGAGLIGGEDFGEDLRFSHLGLDIVFQTGDPLNSEVPEPSTVLLLGAGAGAVLYRRRKSSKTA